jgi:hypothetical protein
MIVKWISKWLKRPVKVEQRKICHKTLLADIAELGFVETKLSMFEMADSFLSGPYRYLKKYINETLFSDCDVLIYTNIYKGGMYGEILTSYSFVGVNFVSKSATRFKSMRAHFDLAGMECYEGNVNDFLNFLYCHYSEMPSANLQE